MIVLKNILRIICDKGFYYKIDDTINIPIRFSKNKNSWVFDNGTNLLRDTEGVSLENINNFYKIDYQYNKGIRYVLNNLNSNTDQLFEQLKMKKNSNRIFCFKYKDDDNCYIDGLFLKKKKNLYYPLDINDKILEECIKNTKFKINKKDKFIKNYISLYQKFKKELLDNKIVFENKNNKIDLDFNSYVISKNNAKFKIKFNNKIYNSVSIKLFNLVNTKDCFFELYSLNKDYLFSYLLLYINNLFFKFIKKEFGLSEKNIIVKENNIFYKIKNYHIESFNVEENNKEETYNYSLLLPKTY